ncbi:MAG: GAF domain-containing protein [candidate division Zixibacteria bacterium]|nr:GAF domain-containing protein [candidate division Zixibacteria bacterium]
MTSNEEKTVKITPGYIYEEPGEALDEDTQKIKVSDAGNVLAEMEAALDEIADGNPRIDRTDEASAKSLEDLRALLQVSLAVNSSLVVEDSLQIVMKKAIELLNAERGFIMLLDETGTLQFKVAYNISTEFMHDKDFKISHSIANEVAATGKSVYTSDAQSDKRYANQESIMELHLRSIMCVPLKIKSKVIGVVYLDNSSQAKLFLKSDLFLFELFAQQAAYAIHNAGLYDHLLDLKQYNEMVVNNSPVGIVVIDAQYNVLSMNDAALAILEKNKEDVRLYNAREEGTRFFELVPENSSAKWRQMVDSALTTNQPFEDSRFFHNTGYEEKVLTIKISPTSRLPYGGDGLILVIEDITEKVIMEKYVILSEKLVARGEMAASIGHELNNYLTIIANNAELLALNIEKTQIDKAKFNCGQIVESIQKMKRFTDGLMDFSKLETEVVTYDIKLLIEDLLFSIKAQSRFKNMLFTVDLAADIPSVKIDVGQIQQILVNLFNNAADATEERARKEQESGNDAFKRSIAIAAYHQPKTNRVLVTVTDNGVGITPEGMEKLFLPYYTTKESGHGLGLVNCKKIAKNHKGDLTVTSQPNEGTTFTLTIPVEPDPSM